MTAFLEISAVSKAFGGIRALDACSLEIPEGAISGLIGPNGSGKTTLFNVITGYQPVRDGVVRFKGRPITNLSPDKVFRLGIGRTFQLTRVFGRLSVLDNMLVAAQHQHRWLSSAFRGSGSHGERRRALELLDFVGIARLSKDTAETLSYGQRKLLELAYVLMADPAVLLLDEPAGGVNPTLVNQIASRIRELNRDGRTFLIVEHNMEFVMGLCHKIAVMNQGSVILDETPEIVRTDPRVLNAYLGGADEDDDEDEDAVV